MTWCGEEANFIIFMVIVVLCMWWLIVGDDVKDHFMYEMPWWNNTPLTRNQSYDLRGDPPMVYYPWISPLGVNSWAS